MTPPDPGTARPSAVIDEIAALGPFFAFTTHAVAATEAAGGRGTAQGPADAGEWQSLDGPAAAARVAAVRQRLAAAGGRRPEAIEPRVAASVAHLGLAARLLSPELAAAVLYDALLGHTLTAVRWRPLLGGPVPLSLPRSALHALRPPTPAPAAAAPHPDALADAFAARLADGPLAELAALHAPFGVSPHILLGNTASALGGATAMIGAARPDLAAPAAALSAAVLAREPLRAQAGRTAAGAFRRRSCCLIYRAAPDRRGALCGDCALDPTDRRP